MLDRLVAVRVLAHVERDHFDHLMDHPAVSADLHIRRGEEDLVEFFSKSLIATHQLDQARNVLKHTPCPVPC